MAYCNMSGFGSSAATAYSVKKLNLTNYSVRLVGDGATFNGNFMDVIEHICCSKCLFMI